MLETSIVIKVLVSGLAILSSADGDKCLNHTPCAEVKMPVVSSKDWLSRRILIPDHEPFLAFVEDQWTLSEIDCELRGTTYGRDICWVRLEDRLVHLELNGCAVDLAAETEPKLTRLFPPKMPNVERKRSLQAIDWSPLASDILGQRQGAGSSGSAGQSKVAARALLPYTRRHSCGLAGRLDPSTDVVTVQEYEAREMFASGGRKSAMAAGVLYDLGLTCSSRSHPSLVLSEEGCPVGKLTLKDVSGPVDLAIMQLIPNESLLEVGRHSDSHFVVYRDFMGYPTSPTSGRGAGATDHESGGSGREMLGVTMPRPTNRSMAVPGLAMRLACDSLFLAPVIEEPPTVVELALYQFVRHWCGARSYESSSNVGSRIGTLIETLGGVDLGAKPCTAGLGTPACKTCLGEIRELVEDVANLFLPETVKQTIIPGDFGYPEEYALAGKGPPLCTPIRAN